ncbi:MAG: sodium:solute symporter family protein, partial [Oscillospiraceae bacterium]|nr:sodium:solute symporter family protein [Oscillospiraceae bacterium]
MILTTAQAIGLLISILGIAAIAIYSGSKPQTFDNVNGAPIVAGIIIGTLVGGSSTVGTAQLAYNYGLSAWWFTLGGGIACVVLGLFYAKPLRRSGCMTLTGILGREFGEGADMAASCLSSVGMFIN